MNEKHKDEVRKEATALLYGRLSDGIHNVRLVTAIRRTTCQNDDDATINFGERRYDY
jgi:hypothetical protein